MTFEHQLKTLSKIQNVSIEPVDDVFVARMKDIYLYEDKDFSVDSKSAISEGVTVEDAVKNLWNLVKRSGAVVIHKGMGKQQECFWDGRKFVPRGTFEFQQAIKREKAEEENKKHPKNRFNMLEM